MKWAVVVEKCERNWSAYVPDLPGCAATGVSVAAAKVREGFWLVGVLALTVPGAPGAVRSMITVRGVDVVETLPAPSNALTDWERSCSRNADRCFCLATIHACSVRYSIGSEPSRPQAFSRMLPVFDISVSAPTTSA